MNGGGGPRPPGEGHARTLETLLAQADADITFSRSKPETDGERRLRLFKDGALFTVGLLMVLALFGASLWVMFDPRTDETQRRWCQSLVFAVMSAFLTYLVRRG